MPGSIAALVRDYRASTDYLGLSDASKRDYGHYLDDIKTKFGKFAVMNLSRKIALAYRDAMAVKTIIDEDGNETTIPTPSKANYAMAVLRKLLSFACDRGVISINYALRPKRLKTGAHKPWGEPEIKRFSKVANDRMNLALALALYTGQRQGDILRMRWNQRVDGGIKITQGKTGVDLWIPMHSALRKALESAPKKAITILSSAQGKPYTSDHFKHEWREATLKAGLDGYVFHGLRKTATGYLAEAGCSSEQIKSITGHKTDRMVSHYVAGAKQKERARSAIHLMEQKCTTVFQKSVQPKKKCRLST